jgi:hypothetical protein
MPTASVRIGANAAGWVWTSMAVPGFTSGTSHLENSRDHAYANPRLIADWGADRVAPAVFDPVDHQAQRERLPGGEFEFGLQHARGTFGAALLARGWPRR